jgi:hypothetical protein
MKMNRLARAAALFRAWTIASGTYTVYLGNSERNLVTDDEQPTSAA